MNTVTRHVGIIGNQLSALEQSVAWAQENSFHTARRAAFDRECREIFGIRDLAMQQVNSLLGGLAELRSEGRASPNLIHSEDMYAELAQVRARAYEEGYELLMERDSLIWRQDCSHILAANYTLFVYVHVPLGAVNSRLRLYEYLENPVRIAGQLMVLSPREHMLAVSDDQMRSREVSADYLRGCDRHAGTFYCCLLYTSPSPRDLSTSRMPSSA